MQLTIIPIDLMVSINGTALQPLNLTPCNIPANVHALQWFETKGWIEFNYSIELMEKPENQIITELPEWANLCVETYNSVPPTPAPTPEQLNKQAASDELYATDWTSIPDITDPAKCTPTLLNQAEFLTYRNQLRAIATNPPAMIVQMPTRPKAQWSAT